LEQLLALRERALDSHSDMLSVKANLNDEILRGFLEMMPDRAFAGIATSVGIEPSTSNSKQLVARHLEYYGGPLFDRIEQAFAAASGHEAMIKALDERIAEYVNELVVRVLLCLGGVRQREQLAGFGHRNSHLGDRSRLHGDGRTRRR
jgi:hypothetical protein